MSKALKIKNYPDYYATDNGDIYSRNYNHTGRIKKMTPQEDKDGYLRVIIRKNGKKYFKPIHRLVAETFIPNPENKPQINHKNGIRTDNRIENLEFCSAAENIQHAYKTLGRKGPRVKIVQQIKNGKIIAEFLGTCDAARKLGISRSSISACCIGVNKTGHGFQWKYKE